MAELPKYSGQHTGKIDSKGRIAIPSKFRANLGDKFYITRGVNGCLFIYDEQNWSIFLENFANLKGQRSTSAARWFIAYLEELTPDQQGRVRIPAELRRCADIDNQVLFAGVGSHLEVWNPTDWEVQFTKTEEEMPETCEYLIF